jgi:DNA-binding transcriptional regulator YhcF (GntR family)
VGVEAPWSTPGPFLTRLAGMAKFAIAQRSGMLGLPRMAVALAQRPLTVQRGLEWLAASGYIQLWQTDGEWVAAPGDLSNAQPERAARLHSLVAALLQETAAFRRAWKERMEF